MQRLIPCEDTEGELKLIARLWLTTARVSLRLLWWAWKGDEPPQGQAPAEMAAGRT